MASHDFPVAIIGVAVQLPGAKNCEEFWDLMVNRGDTVSSFPAERVGDIDHVVETFRGQLVDEDNPFYTGSFFKSVDKFDAELFQINPKEALFIEPEQRMFLQTVWELLEDAGYASRIRDSNTGVYVGNTVNKYKYILTENHPSISHGNHSPFISSRVSFTYNLSGPAMMVATGCSSSLLAVHLACQGLLSGDCEMAIAGGITLDLLPISTKTDIWNQLGITGPNVKCRAFDAQAKGIAKAEGCGVVLLKPLEKAIADGDNIYGVLEATTANQDGHSQGITAPHPGAQANMLNQAWDLAKISPERLGYIEAHGTGTELGDPIEIMGITRAFDKAVKKDITTLDKRPIGSVKANIGHLADGGAGIVALIKSILCIKHSKIPPAVNFTQPNPHINWDRAPVFVNTTEMEWRKPDDGSPRYGSVSAFGLLGTNIHAVVREFQNTNTSAETCSDNMQILCIAARSKESLTKFVTSLLAYFTRHGEKTYAEFSSVCFTLNKGRELRRFKTRASLVANSWSQMTSTIEYLLSMLSSNNSDTDSWIAGMRSLGDDTETILSNLHEEQRTTLDRFVRGEQIKWDDYYRNSLVEEKKMIGHLPTYCFQETRFWPSVSKPINQQLLKLEHQIPKSESPTQEHSKEPINLAAIDSKLAIIVQEVLGTPQQNGSLRQEDLMTLGVDSLMFNQLQNKINELYGVNITMNDFRVNTTISLLADFIYKRVTSEGAPNITSNHCSFKESRPHRQTDYDVRGVLVEALAGALGSDYNWNEFGDTSLFSIGVDSLVYAHVTMHINEKLGINIGHSALYAHPTFNQFLEWLETHIKDVNDRSCHLSSKPVDNTQEHADAESDHPLSFSQRRLWVIEKMDRSTCAYNATNGLKISGDFHPNAFKQAMAAVISRHSAFYTTIQEGGDQPMVRYAWNVDVNMECKDFRSFGKEANKRAIDEYETDYKTGFDLSNGSLVRTKLYRVSEDTYFFTMVIHHIIFDGWSHFVFYNELWDTYTKITQGEEIRNCLHMPLYVTFSRREHNALNQSNSVMQKDMDYWMKQLGGTLPLTTFPGDKKRPQVFSFEGGRITRFIDMKTIHELHNSVSVPHTLFNALLASVFVMLQMFNGEEDMIVGIPVAGRDSIDMKHVIGCFINTLAIRVSLTDTMSFAEAVERVKTVCFEAQEHQTAPFDHLVSQLKLPRNTSITPVFSVNVCYHNTEAKESHVSPPVGLVVERHLLHNATSKWDVQFDFLEEGDEMRFTLEYYKGAFSDQYAHHLVDSFVELLDVLSDNPDKRLVALQDQQPSSASILYGPVVDLGEKNLSELILDALQTHSKSTVTDIDKTVHTFHEILKESKDLAIFFLETFGLTKGDRMGLLFGNSYESVCIILACLITGIVYVPLNPENPKGRLELIVNEANISAICFSKENLATANHLQWSCSSVRIIYGIDINNIADAVETEMTPLMEIELWDCVAEEADNDIEGGGWKSSYTGEYMSEHEMNDYTKNVLSKLQNYLNQNVSVLEIGCASGLTTQELCSQVYRYVATDLSPEMIKKMNEKKLENVEAYCLAADAVGEKFKGDTFEVIIINSVTHCFPGHSYMRKILQMCAHLLNENGIIFVGDVMDLNKRECLVSSLKAYKEAHPEQRTKTEWHAELFLSKEFFISFCEKSDTLTSASCSQKIASVPNELTKYRFDVIMSNAASSRQTFTTIDKQQFAASDVNRQGIIGPQFIRKYAQALERDDDAYILYTSGTTGLPKGVRISQRSLLNYTKWAADEYRLETVSVIPLFSPLTFDFTLTSIVPPILNGSSIEIFKPFKESYIEMANSTNLTVGKFSPIQLDTMLTSACKPISISKFIIGGEELTSKLLKKLKDNKNLKPFCVWNEYGPTEATVGCVVKCINSEDIANTHRDYVPIGRPINNVTVAVVRDSAPVVKGGKGCLAIGGSSLCTGFVNTKTNTSAMKSAPWGTPGDLMYVTTDVVEFNPVAKELLYFGRESTDITKINEIRVDVLEIQQAIANLPMIEDAWVSTFEYKRKTFLGAAVKGHHGCTFGEDEWKNNVTRALAGSLPFHCIPKVFVLVTETPTNTNGKKDVHLLKELFIEDMNASGKQTGEQYQENATPTQQKLRDIWKSILPINNLPNLDDDFFFALSGDSLQAIHLVRKMRNSGFHVAVNDIFQNPTIRKLSTVLKKIKNQDAAVCSEASVVSFRPTPIIEKYFQRKGSSDRFALAALLQFDKSVQVDEVQNALRAVISKHRTLSSTIVMEDGVVYQKYMDTPDHRPHVVKVVIQKTQKDVSEEPEFISTCEMLECEHNLQTGLLVNAAIFEVHGNNQTEWYCLILAHHVVVDIVSWQQILEDLASAFQKLSTDEKAYLSPCVIPFDVFCGALRQEINDNITNELEYWKTVHRLQETSGRIVQSNAPSKYKNAHWLSKEIDAVSIRQMSKRMNGTDEALLLATLGKAISKLHGKNSTTICLESHGRQVKSVESTDTVGWCTSMFPFVVNGGCDETMSATVRQVDSDLSAIYNHGIGYGILRSQKQIQCPLPDIMFGFLGSLDASTKEHFDGGAYKFTHIPWIEVMLRELEEKRFHRHDEDVLDFAVEFICWIHGGTLKIGCLFDKQAVLQSDIEVVMNETERILQQEAHSETQEEYHTVKQEETIEGQVSSVQKCDNTLNEKTATKPHDSENGTSTVYAELLQHSKKSATIEDEKSEIDMLANIIITPECVDMIENILNIHGCRNRKLTAHEPEEFFKALLDYRISQSKLVVIVIRNKTECIASDFNQAFKIFIKNNKESLDRCFIVSLEHIHDSVPLDEEASSSIVTLRPYFDGTMYDSKSDVEFNMPLSQEGYKSLAINVARTIRKLTADARYKVICVDADYTLWDGECANGTVCVTHSHRLFQTFLLEKKQEGVLLVLLSKNIHEDVVKAIGETENMLIKQEDFVLMYANWNSKTDNVEKAATALNLNLDSFLFIDDSVMECEHMIVKHKEVTTLQYPSEDTVVQPFLESLWILDKSNVTQEASKRTDMYKNELSRVDDTHAILENMDDEDTGDTFTDLLKQWHMKMTVFRTKVSAIKGTDSISERAAELLYRTNQFKLNMSRTQIEDFESNDECWLVSLEDKYGSYGIVSVCILQTIQENTVMKQWVVSCRALNRQVEHRLMHEILSSLPERNTLQLEVENTGKNEPMLHVLSHVVDVNIHGNTPKTVTRKSLDHCHLPEIHAVQWADNVSDLTTPVLESTCDTRLLESRTANCSVSINADKWYKWIAEHWTDRQKSHAIGKQALPLPLKNKCLPMIPADFEHGDKCTEITRLQKIWMTVLETNSCPRDDQTFLESGGNSFKAVFLISTVREEYNIQLNIVDILRNPTFCELQDMVQNGSKTKPANHLQDRHDECHHADKLPLSSAQKRMFVLQTTIPESTAYTETIAIQTNNEVDIQYVSKQLAALHPILTAQIDPRNTTLAYAKTMEIDHTVCEFETLEELKAQLSTSKPVFQVAGGKLSQIKIAVSNTLKKTVVIVHVHHMIVDDITLQNIKVSLLQILHKPANPKPMSTSVQTGQPTVVTFLGEQDYSKSSDADEDCMFWQTYFESCPDMATLSLTSSANRNDFSVHSAETMVSTLPTDGVEEIHKYCRSIEVTEFQFFLACLTLTIQRYLGTKDVVIAVPVSTRDVDSQTTDGLFVNTVLFKYTIQKNMTFNEFVLDVSAAWLCCLSHSRYPLDKVGELLWEKHGMSINSLCSIMFNYATFPPDTDEIKVNAKHSKMQFSIDIGPTCDHRYDVACEYSSDEMDHSIVSRFNETLIHTFEQCVLAQDNKLQDIEFLCQRELDLIASLNHKRPRTEQANTVLEKFLKHAECQPDSIAVQCEEKHVSYEKLYSMALKVESALKIFDKKVLETQPIVLCMDKNEQVVAAMFGVWLAGGHFIPVSTLHSEKLNDLAQTTCPCAIVVNTLNEMASRIQNCEVLTMADMLQHQPGNDSKHVTPIGRLSDPAYIIQTSGSTGIPKRIQISHDNLSVIADAWAEVYDMTSYKVNVLQWAPLTFDVFIGDVVRALCCAPGTLCICPDERRLDVQYIGDMMRKSQITIAELTPQFGIHLVENTARENVESLKVLILGSDILQKEVYNRVKACLKDRQHVFNSYGMSEATIDSACFEGDILSETRGGTVPIGKPLPGVTLHVLESDSLRPCPVGTVGELFIGGPVVGSGDTELIPSKNGDSLLKTKDKACLLPSGDLELLGRFDQTCKLRGFRINTVEIENTILRHCSYVQDAVVVIKKNASGVTDVQFLCAFVTLKTLYQSTDNVPNQVIETIKERHPYYMIPDIVQVLESIPLSSNGKVDNRALPNIESIIGTLSNKKRNELSSTAKLLQSLFAEALGMVNDSSRIAAEHTFMEQGGHSLVLVQFHSLIKQRTTLDVTIADIFTYPSISSLAEYIDKGASMSTEDDTLDTELATQSMDSALDIAITGVGMRLPGDVMSLGELWKVLDQDEDLIEDFPATRKDDILKCSPAALSSELQNCDEFQGAFLSSIDRFDNSFFNISSGEAQIMSPEQRLFLEVATETLSDGTDISKIKGGKVGVFLSNTEIGYSKLQHSDDAIEIAGLMPGMIATRLAYQYNLKGPTMLIDTACSSSLVALKIASESIRKGECNSALVGGMNITMYPARKGVHGDKGILSSDFHCRAFDQDADGTAVGEGVICFYVEPLESALRRNKRIYGVVKSVATNSVGKGNGITAPTATSQEQVIKQALRSADMKPSDVSFVESHGTGTTLGDKIELSGLASVFNSSTTLRKLPIGSVKSMFGHLDYAAGMIGLLKLLASFTFRKIPPTVHFKYPHPELKNSLLYVPNRTEDWELDHTSIRAAGLSSFGLTGTNCHAILTEAPSGNSSCDCPSEDETWYPLLFSCVGHDQVKKQASLYESLITQTVVKHQINTIGGICRTVAKQLQHLSEAKLGYNQIRIVAMAKTTNQVLPLLRLIKGSESSNIISRLCAVRNDVLVSMNVLDGAEAVITSDMPRNGISLFLQNGTIDCKKLFTSITDETTEAIGVKLIMFDSKRHWLKPNCIKSFESIGLIDLLHKKVSKTREMVRTIPLAPTQDLIKTEGEFCASIILNFFKDTRLKEVMETSEKIKLHKAFQLTNMQEKYDKLFFVMIRELWNNGLVISFGHDSSVFNLDTFSFRCKDLHLQEPEVIAKDAMARYPAWADCFRFPLHCCKYLKDVLCGDMSPLSVIYPKGDLNFMFQFDRLGDLLGEVYYNMYMQLIVEYAAQLSSKGRKVRILEVGAGMGHVTRQLLPNLVDIPNIEYWFTDLGRAFVENAKTLFEKYQNMMKFSTFDITKNAPKQGLLGAYDIVISYNVIHTTESVTDSVVNLKSCLGDDGTLFIIESAKNETWATLAWGILDGWWYFKDYDLRAFEPMLEPDKWEEVLRKAKFGSVHSCPRDPEERKHVEKFLFICSAKARAVQTEYVPNSEWWNSVDLTIRRHADFVEEDISATSSDTGLGDDCRIDPQLVKSELKRIWCELLDVQDVHEEDDFNSLGGESLLAIQMMTMVRKRIGYQLEIADTFCYPSLGILGDFIANQLDAITRSSCTSPCNSDVGDVTSELEQITVEETDSGCMLMFPGQGAQKIGMCVSMADSEPAKSVFRIAEKITGYNVLDICMKEDDELDKRLKSTEFVQVSLLTGCIAKMQQLKCENPEILVKITHVAGLSVGEFAALVYAEVLTLEDAIKIVQHRGRAMEVEVKKSASAMASVLGPSGSELQTFIQEYFPNTEISTYLADTQHTVAGSDDDIDRLVEILSSEKKDDMSIVDVRRLRVAGAFHSSFMEKAAKVVNPIIQSCEFRRPQLPVIMNITGKACEDPEEIKALVMRQLTEGVMWRQTVVTAYDLGVREFIEVAPARVLTSIARTRIQHCKGCKTELIVV